MSDFDVAPVQTVGPARVSFPVWSDLEDGDDPTRLNARGHVPHRYTRIAAGAGVLEFNAIVDGVQAPAEAALLGRAISWSFGVIPEGAPMPAITSPVGGKSSRATFAIGTAYPGHYVIVARRAGGGHVGYPFDVEPTT